MELFRINVEWIPKWFHMARQQEVERFYPIVVFLSAIEPCQRTHCGWTCNWNASYCRQMLEPQRLRGQTRRPANHAHPRLTNPIPILARWIKRVSQMTETVLGPSVLVIVDALLKEDGVAVLIA
jgi:hypothetical protein